jgi:hypothetical protein
VAFLLWYPVRRRIVARPGAVKSVPTLQGERVSAWKEPVDLSSGTSWAVLALSMTEPVKTMVLLRRRDGGRRKATPERLCGV